MTPYATPHDDGQGAHDPTRCARPHVTPRCHALSRRDLASPRAIGGGAQVCAPLARHDPLRDFAGLRRARRVHLVALAGATPCDPHVTPM
eukprot:6573427-Prymnesium_polylepis.1